MRIVSKSEIKTRAIGKRVAQKLIKRTETKNATVVCLRGNLGSGKTIFAQGFGRGLGITGRIQSPTFVLMRRYRIKPRAKKTFAFFYHLDLYRIHNSKEIKYLDLKDIFNDASAVILIEWAEKISRSLPSQAVNINFEHVRKSSARIITIDGIDK